MAQNTYPVFTVFLRVRDGSRIIPVWQKHTQTPNLCFCFVSLTIRPYECKKVNLLWHRPENLERFWKEERVKACLIGVAQRQQNKGNSVPWRRESLRTHPSVCNPSWLKNATNTEWKAPLFITIVKLEREGEKEKDFYYKTPSNRVALWVFFLLVHSLFKCTFIPSNLIKNIWNRGQACLEHMWRVQKAPLSLCSVLLSERCNAIHMAHTRH